MDLFSKNVINIFKNVPIDIDIFNNVLIDIDIDIFKNGLIDSDIDIFKNHLIDIFKKYRYFLSIYRTPLDSDDSDYSEDGVKSYYVANVAKAKKAKREREALREENGKLKMENEGLLRQNGELMDTIRMASLLGCFDKLDKGKPKDAMQKMSK